MLSIQRPSSNSRSYQPITDPAADFFDEYCAKFSGTSDVSDAVLKKESAVVHTPKSHPQLEIVLDVTGFLPENIAVRLEGNILRIMAFYESKCDVNYPELIQHEIHNERLLHIFQLGGSLEVAQVKTSFDEHRLHISVPMK